MDKQKRWQFYLILAVCILTLYNILPTIFYYTKPLGSPIDDSRAMGVAKEVVERVNVLEEDAKDWLYSFAKLLGVKPQSIELESNDPRLVRVTFANGQEAAKFSSMLTRAGARIPFAPAQLRLYEPIEKNPNVVWVARQIDVRLDPNQVNQLFQYTSKYDEQGKITPLYRETVYDRVAQVALSLAGPSAQAQQMEAVVQNPSDTSYDDLVLSLAKDIVEGEAALKGHPEILQRWFGSFVQSDQANAQTLITRFIARLETQASRLETRRQELNIAQSALKQSGDQFDPAQGELLAIVNNQYNTLNTAKAILKNNLSIFKTAPKPFTLPEILTDLRNSTAGETQQIFSLQGRNPFIEKLAIDWADDRLMTIPYADVQAIRQSETLSENVALLQERLNQYLINSLARASTLSDEAITPDGDLFAVNLNQLTGTQSLLIMNLGSLAQHETNLVTQLIDQQWKPAHPDLERSNYPLISYGDFEKEGAANTKLGLLVYAPAAEKETPPKGFRSDSIYVIARGLVPLLDKMQQDSSAPENVQLKKELDRLITLLQSNGYIGYPGNAYAIDPRFKDDYIFERDDFYSNLIKATRENFIVKGSKRYALLNFSDVEQRILAWNAIEDRIQEDLVKWKEEYSTSQVDLDLTNHYLVPAPTKNVYWENFKLSAQKYFRGDDRKILKWGLDLSGGKTVRIGLRDHNNRPVTNPEDLHQAVNELYARVNKLGVSERTIRVESNNIVLDFPGAQGLSARDLVKASSMAFHIVNEKFSTYNPSLKEAVNRFLEEVWNEAVVTNRKDIESINEIAWKHLGGSSQEGVMYPRGEYAKVLWDNGLRLANPKQDVSSASFNDTLSMVGMLRGDGFTEWEGHAHPLEIVFFNYALEGSSLDRVTVGFDPSQGNLLTFGIKGYYEGDRVGNPRDDFYTWTSQFAEDKIRGTNKEAYAPDGRGWRMAVILNGRIISQPTLRSALRDGGTISGRFSQREVNQLAADLKAGSLSFTPRILSEQNVSPELGQEERTRGVLAAVAATILVFIFMIYVYRFGGLVASCALFFNILIMWGILQNLDAAITLPGIAGIVLTIGMAIDANVLVFERVREEFKISGRIGPAIQAGYRKAFSAIIDSNITTIIAALILIQFDSGPIRGFAVTIIIGIVSSMFTALFMTRYFFAGWVKNPKNKSLNMRQLIGETHFNFLAQAKKAVIVSLILVLGGAFLFIDQRRTIFGMDFTGGYSLTLEVAEKSPPENYRLQALDALLAAGATTNDVQVRELGRANQLRIQLSTSMEERGHPFYQMSEEQDGKFTYSYQHNPRIDWVVEALQAGGLTIPADQLTQLEGHWTVMSGQFSDTMRNNAILGLLLSLLAILVYITIRFEFKYAISAVLGLAYDVIVSLGVIAMFHWIGMPVQIDLQVVGAIMMIVGYSLNDTIIVFDRIREDIYLHRKWKFQDIINHALNVTLSRTMITSGSTLMVLMMLVLLGGPSIFGFSLVMAIGVVVGTLSSLFVASPILLYFHEREERAAQQKSLDYKRS